MNTHARSVYRFLGMLAVLGWQTASAVEVSWTRQSGSAKYIASNASASLWMIGMDDSKVYKWTTNQFVDQGFSAIRIGVTTADKLWLIDEIGLKGGEFPLY